VSIGNKSLISDIEREAKMKTLVIGLATLIFMSSSAFAQCKVEAYFSPYDNVETVVVNRLNGAQEYVKCSLYGITNKKITETLIKKMSDGVSVMLCLDKIQSSGSSSKHKELENAGADVVIKKTGVLEHNKFCVIDGKIVIMGSWNFSANAQKQDNSTVEITVCGNIIDKFEDAFERIYNRDK
jgi:phosphatidylserine/phosphatidylglycerophosphate/cardiolipin synthase-like enzyme